MSDLEDCILNYSEDESRYGEIRVYDRGAWLQVCQHTKSQNIYGDRDEIIEKLKFELAYKDKPRVYCNQLVDEEVRGKFRYFFAEGASIIFHNSPEFRTSGSVIASSRSIELSFFMPHTLMKKTPVYRLLLRRASKQDGVFVEFKVQHKQFVEYADRNNRFPIPVITFG